MEPALEPKISKDSGMVGSHGPRNRESIDKANIQLGKILRNRLQIIGTVLRSRTLEEKINLTNQFKNDFLCKFSQKKIHPVIDRVYPYHLANEAHELMENNANTGKIILDFTT